MIESERLSELVALVLNCDPATLQESDGLVATKNWDSVSHVAIIVAIEEAFDIEFEFDELDELITLAAIRQSLCEKVTP
ncbi:MAG: acyl carrier protein [Boseongicola sp.]